MPTITCAGCGEIIDVPAELCPDDQVETVEPYYCDACEDFVDYLLEDDEPDECCPYCGKAYEDFSDMGCGYCDRRSPDWGVMP